MSDLKFYKIQSTGNDFIVADFNDVPGSFYSAEKIQSMCDRHLGIGADGFIAVEKSDSYAFRFHYYNADGSRGALCANGCRAAIVYADQHNWISKAQAFNFLADDGLHKAQAGKDEKLTVEILVNDTIKPLNLNEFSLPDWILEGYRINTGVPHIVLLCKEGLVDKEIYEPGRYLRYHNKFSPDGTNVNFAEVSAGQKIFVRTYERGVENETLSCGSGVAATGLVLAMKNNSPQASFTVSTQGGMLHVFSRDGSLFISGPSQIVFAGTIRI